MKRTLLIEIYRSGDEWYWRAIKKGNITCIGGEGYASEWKAKRAVAAVIKSFAGPVEIRTKG